MLKHRVYKTIFWLVLVLIIIVMLLPAPQTGQVSYLDKVVHFLIFMVPGFLFYLGSEDKRYRLFPFLVLLAFAAGVELLQGFVPYRSFDWLDLLTNMVGISMFQFARIFNKPT